MKVATRSAHVLVVEDDRDTREVVKLILELEGFGVSEARDGLEALQRLYNLRTEDSTERCAIVLDVMMPRCSGYEFRRRQLNDPLIADIPVIVVSAVADRAPFDELRPFATIHKPFDPDHLLSVVRRACGV